MAEMRGVSRVLRVVILTAKNFFKRSPKQTLRVHVTFAGKQRFGGKRSFDAKVIEVKIGAFGRRLFIITDHPFKTLDGQLLAVDLFCAEEEYKKALQGLDFTVRGKIDGRVFRHATAVRRIVDKKEKACTADMLAVCT